MEDRIESGEKACSEGLINIFIGIELLLLMLTSDAAVSNHLTQFLKHFKTSMHSHICFVEFFFANSSDDEKCKKAQ